MSEHQEFMEPNARDNLFSSLGRMEGMMNSLVSQHNELARLITDNTGRISKLENYKSWLMGAAVTAGVVSSFIFKHL